MPKLDRRRSQRVKINVLGRYMLSDHREFPCHIRNMSPTGLALTGPVVGAPGEVVVAYVDHIGRIEGEIARIFQGGFAMTIRATAAKRDKLAAQLTWLANRHQLDLPEDRRHEREVPDTAVTTVTMPDGKQHTARIIDMSLSGAALNMQFIPEIGTPVQVGKIRSRVVRVFDSGIAVEFATSGRSLPL